MAKETTARTLRITLILSLVCSILVSTCVVLLKPMQKRNIQLDIERTLLNISGLVMDDVDLLSEQEVSQLFKQIKPRLVDLKKGVFIEKTPTGSTAANFDQRASSKHQHLSKALNIKQDIAHIKRQENIAKVYTVELNGAIKTLVLPVRGYGLWSTMYGFVALDRDLNTIVGFGFFEQGETPGLGGKVDNSKWKKTWIGKRIYDTTNKVAFSLVKSYDPSSSKAVYGVDALSGATLTTEGVNNLIKFWMSDNGFKPFLKNLKEGETK